jgi:hypothetical protein
LHCRYIPDVLLGDLDSVDESVVKFYQAQVYTPFAPSLTYSRLPLRRHHRRTVPQACAPRLAVRCVYVAADVSREPPDVVSFHSPHLDEHPVPYTKLWMLAVFMSSWAS